MKTLILGVLRLIYLKRISGCSRFKQYLPKRFRFLLSIPNALSNGPTIYEDFQILSTHAAFDGTIVEADDAERLSPVIE